MTISTKKLKAVAVGAGYFSQFHFDAWSRMPDVDLAAVCDLDAARAEQACRQFGVARHDTGFERMLDAEQPDFVDVITRPESHREHCAAAAARGIDIICQKPLAPTIDEAREIVGTAERAGVRLMVHENFRFQPWHREIKRLLEAGTIGEQVYSLTFRTRTGDGWGDDAYLARQPYFREMPQFLLYETGVHLIDTFRFLAGDVRRVFYHSRRLNPTIAGEDCGLLLLEFNSGAVGVWDANRFNESNAVDPRYTFGQFLVEGSGGTIRLAADGTLTVQPLGELERTHAYHHEPRGFGGDCVLATQRHYVDCLRSGEPFETDGWSYLANLAAQEAAYRSAREGRIVDVAEAG